MGGHGPDVALLRDAFCAQLALLVPKLPKFQDVGRATLGTVDVVAKI